MRKSRFHKRAVSRGRTSTIGSVVNQVLQNIEVKIDDPCHEIVAIWEEVAGARIAGHARPTALEGRTLKVEVDSSTWQYELSSFRGAQIKSGINDRLGRSTIEKIVFRLARKKRG
jgi:predicted nucleic acid-binding Zn ribbon protein